MHLKLPYFHFMRHSKRGLYVSLILTVLALAVILLRGFNFGLELTGGATIELHYQQPADIQRIRDLIRPIHPDASVIQYGSSQDVQIRFSEREGQDTDALMRAMTATLAADAPFTLAGQAKIGGQYREELVEKGIAALLLSSLGMVIYLSLRFEWKFAVGAVLAQLHDVILTAAFFSLMQWTFDLTVLAALLAVLGYSVNDTVVVYDRIRENFLLQPQMNSAEVIDDAINQTLARTSITSITTLLAVLTLAIFGGVTLFSFAIAMMIGILVGTYSSIFVAGALVYALGVQAQDLLPKRREDIDDLP